MGLRAAWRALWQRPHRGGRAGLVRFLSFAGAATNRLFEDWVATWMSGRDENRWELRLLRNRSREQSRNNPIFRRYLALLDENVLGPQGITLKGQEVLGNGGAGTPDEETNQQLEAAWEEWGEAANCSVDRRLTWREFQGAVLEAVARDGECLVELVPAFANPYGFALRLIDIDLLDDYYNVSAGTGQNAVIQGVELDAWGAPVAYHLWTQHPTAMYLDSMRRRVRVPAANILHIGRLRRADQVRYEPWSAPVLVQLRMLDEYMKAELVASRSASENVGFIEKSPDGAAVPDPDDLQAMNATFETSKGTVQTLATGETFKAWPADHPTTAFNPFVTTLLRSIAQGLGVSHFSLSGDLTQANYSSMRTGMIGERDHFELLQQWLIAKLHKPVYRMWLRQAVIWQQVRLPGRLADTSEPLWQCRGWDWVDPEKDVTAGLIAAGAGLTSLTRLCAERGLDFRTVLQERKAEQDLADKLGVKITLAKPGETPKQEGTATTEDAAPAGQVTPEPGESLPKIPATTGGKNGKG